mmetsp:Transcript_18102/g.31791  ORF Transcript_18102/g.31791 Transcript_18102/m.31791 type:complete len:490 (+) Transcript_18102:97-1566(+)
MGNLFGKKELTPEEKQRQLQEKYGVLIPPVFVVSRDDGYTSDSSGMPVSTQAQLRARTDPSIIEHLWMTSTGRSLLQEYMQPGIFFSVPTNGQGQIRMALNTREATSTTPSYLPSYLSSTPPSATPETSFLCMTQRLTPTLPFHIQMLIPASSQVSPSLQLISPSNGGLVPRTTVTARVNPIETEKSLLEALVTLPCSDIGIKLGAWMDVDSIQNLWNEYTNDTTSNNQQQSLSSPFSSTRKYSPSTIHLQGVSEYGDSILAAHAEIPLSPNSGKFIPEKTDTMLWLNLSTTDSSTSSSSSKPTPPLWLTLKQSHTRGDPLPEWTLNLSQILTFDRTIWNILEDRAPLIRNHLGWAVQLQRDAQQNSSWSVGASMQFNRNVAAKAVLDNGKFLRSNIIFKRWMQPRLTLSVLNGMDLTTGRVSFLGFGVEIETTAAILGQTQVDVPCEDSVVAANGNGDDDAKYQETTNLEGNRAPPNKIQVNVPKTKT